MNTWKDCILFGEVLALPFLAATFPLAAQYISRRVKSSKPAPMPLGNRIEPRLDVKNLRVPQPH